MTAVGERMEKNVKKTTKTNKKNDKISEKHIVSKKKGYKKASAKPNHNAKMREGKEEL